MRSIATLVVLTLVGCKKPPVSAGELAFPQYADLACTEARYGGAPPPTGQEIFCVSTATGTPTRAGDAIRYYPTGELAARGAYSQNKQTGEWTYWQRDGGLKRIETWVDGVANGPWTEYHPTGAMSAHGNVQKNQRIGLWTFYDPQGNRFLEGEYTLGLEDGVWREYGPDGEPLRERIYREGRLLRQSEI